MKSKLFPLCLGILLSWSAFGGDSKIFGPSFFNIEMEMSSLEKTFPEEVDRILYGLSPEGHNLTLLRISDKAIRAQLHSSLNVPKSKAVYISGTTHGNEYLNIEDRLPRYFLENRAKMPAFQEFLRTGGVVYSVPILNPDGYERRTRVNARGKDLNRDFPIERKKHAGFTQPESKFLAGFIASDLKAQSLNLAFSMDYHCCQGALIHPWSFEAEPMPSKDLIEHQKIGNLMKAIFGEEYQVGTTQEILVKPRVGTSKDYFYEKYHSLSFTFEGKKAVENNQFPKHVEMWEKIFEYLNNQ